MVTSCRQSLLTAEKENKYVGLERDRAKADLEKPKAAIQERDKALQVDAWE